MTYDIQSQIELAVEVNNQYKYCDSRVNLQNFGIEENSPNEAPPTMSGTQIELAMNILLQVSWKQWTEPPTWK